MIAIYSRGTRAVNQVSHPASLSIPTFARPAAAGRSKELGNSGQNA
ncbi:hypothetical protein QCD60_29020 [Pokkaliibacter sp. MBI-7]|nr:hypothetical protein [Pokkaliibacter sp. MBI-7]MDH2436558.1 hypothetical protein [Pokkaliibacter sp. MBI-7]